MVVKMRRQCGEKTDDFSKTTITTVDHMEKHQKPICEIAYQPLFFCAAKHIEHIHSFCLQLYEEGIIIWVYNEKNSCLICFLGLYSRIVMLPLV